MEEDTGDVAGCQYITLKHYDNVLLNLANKPKEQENLDLNIT